MIGARWVKIDSLALAPPLRWLSTEMKSSVLGVLRQFQVGMRTLRQDGAQKVMRGATSVAEVLRATEEETVVAEI